jgi:Carboxypeptidase regulatory-like domain
MRKALLAILFFLVSAPIWAQVDTGVITGTVNDQAGAVIPSAKVTITSQATGVATTINADSRGAFSSAPIKADVYSVTVTAPGFESETRTGVQLQVQDRLNLEFKMVVGQVSQSVVVSDQTPALQTQTSSLGQVITSETMSNIPLNGRSYLQLATLSTGVVGTTVGTNGNTGGGSNNFNQVSFATNGARGTLNNFLLDGIDNNSNDNGGSILHTSVDAVQEFKIQTSAYSAEFGRSGGAVINAVIKSGTNRYHGDLYEFFRNSALDARSYFEAAGTPKAPFKQNQFGGTLGGPILKDKLFWFGDYEGSSLRLPNTYISTVPSAAEKTGDFSAGTFGTIYDPKSYDPVTNTRTPFAGNIIPANRIDPISQAFVNLYPDANQPGTKNNYVITPVEPYLLNQGDFRGDYHQSDINQYFFRFSDSGQTYLQPQRLPGLAIGQRGGYGFENTKGASLGQTHTFSPSTVNEFRAGFNWIYIHRGVPTTGNAAPPDNLKVPGVEFNSNTAGLTQFTPSGYRGLGEPGYQPTILTSEERQITDVVNLIRGKQTFAVGAEFRWTEFNIFQVPAPNGSFNFSGQFTQNPVDGSGGDGLADALLGLPLTSTIDTQIEVQNRQFVPSAFVQDDYKFSKTLTLNLGVRYDYFSPIVEKHNQQANFDYTTGQLLVAGQNGNSRGLTTPDHYNFSPRVGFAKTLKNDTVLSGAYGIFWSGQEIRTAATLQLAYNLPFYYQPTFTSDGITPLLTVSGGFPTLDPNNAPDPGVTSVDARMKTPSYQQWNLAVQQALPSQTSLEISYAGSKGTHLQALADRNQVVTPGPGDVQSRRPFPTFGPFASIENRGNSGYNSLQVKVEKRASHGLFFLSSFTWGKAINDQPEICCSSPWPQNTWNIGADRGLADFNQNLRWILSYDYLLPFGKGHSLLGSSRVGDLVAGGWHLSGIYSLASGFPFSPQMGYDTSNTGTQGLLRPDQVLPNGNFGRGQRSPNLWFNPDAYAVPADFTFGNAGRNTLIGPDTNSWDSSLRKTFQITESQNVEFRAEFFNFLNHPSFAQPDAAITDGPGATGVVTAIAGANREIQLALKYHF